MSTPLDEAVARLRKWAGDHETLDASDTRLLLGDWERLREKLSSERAQWVQFVDACAQVGVTWTMREPTPEHPIGVEIRNAAASKLARLRERDFALTQVLTRGLHAALVQGKRASVRLDWTVKAMKDALALLKEEP